MRFRLLKGVAPILTLSFVLLFPIGSVCGSDADAAGEVANRVTEGTGGILLNNAWRIRKELRGEPVGVELRISRVNVDSPIIRADLRIYGLKVDDSSLYDTDNPIKVIENIQGGVREGQSPNGRPVHKFVLFKREGRKVLVMQGILRRGRTKERNEDELLVIKKYFDTFPYDLEDQPTVIEPCDEPADDDVLNEEPIDPEDPYGPDPSDP